MTGVRPLAAIVAAAALASILAGCSSSTSSDTADTASAATASSIATPDETSAPPTTAQPGPATTSITTTAPSASDPTAAITAAFTTFFDGVNPDVDGKVAVLEHGDQLRQMIVEASADPQFQQLTTTVNSVSVLPDADCTAAGEVAPCASVAHDMFVGGLPAMVGLQSHAVEIDGVWKVSAKSWCAIVELGGATCPAVTTG